MGGSRWRLFVRDLVIGCAIGVHAHERGREQRVRINVEVEVSANHGPRPINDDIRRVMSYEKIVEGIRRIAASGHINLVETLAERIAQHCLENRRALAVRVRVEKLEVYEDAESVGCELERRRASEGAR